MMNRALEAMGARLVVVMWWKVYDVARLMDSNRR